MEINRYIAKMAKEYREYIEEEEIEQECQLIYLERKAKGVSDNGIYKAIKSRMEALKDERMRSFYITSYSINLGIVGSNVLLNAEKTPSYSLGA